MLAIYTQEVVIRKKKDYGDIKWEDTIKKGCKEGEKPKEFIGCYEDEIEGVKAWGNIKRSNPKSYPKEEYYGAWKIIRFREWALYVETDFAEAQHPDVSFSYGEGETATYKPAPISIGFSIWNDYWNNFDERK